MIVADRHTVQTDRLHMCISMGPGVHAYREHVTELLRPEAIASI